MGVTEKRANEVFRNGVTKEVDPTVPVIVSDLSDVGGELYYKNAPIGGGGGGGGISPEQTVLRTGNAFVFPEIKHLDRFLLQATPTIGNNQIITLEFPNIPDAETSISFFVRGFAGGSSGSEPTVSIGDSPSGFNMDYFILNKFSQNKYLNLAGNPINNIINGQGFRIANEDFLILITIHSVNNGYRIFQELY